MASSSPPPAQAEIIFHTVISAPIDYTLWTPAMSHPSFPFRSPLYLVWPELSALHYNLVQGKANDWGTSPWWYYLFNSLPKTCLASLPLAIAGLLWMMLGTGRMVGGMKEVVSLFGLGVVTLVGGMSCVGHKVSEGSGVRLIGRNGGSSSTSSRSSTSWARSQHHPCASFTLTCSDRRGGPPPRSASEPSSG